MCSAPQTKKSKMRPREMFRCSALKSDSRLLSCIGLYRTPKTGKKEMHIMAYANYFRRSQCCRRRAFQRTFKSSDLIPMTMAEICQQFPVLSSIGPSLIRIWLDAPGTGGKVPFQLVVALWLKPGRRDEMKSHHSVCNTPCLMQTNHILPHSDKWNIRSTALQYFL